MGAWDSRRVGCRKYSPPLLYSLQPPRKAPHRPSVASVGASADLRSPHPGGRCPTWRRRKQRREARSRPRGGGAGRTDGLGPQGDQSTYRSGAAEKTPLETQLGFPAKRPSDGATAPPETQSRVLVGRWKNSKNWRWSKRDRHLWQVGVWGWRAAGHGTSEEVLATDMASASVRGSLRPGGWWESHKHHRRFWKTSGIQGSGSTVSPSFRRSRLVLGGGWPSLTAGGKPLDRAGCSLCPRQGRPHSKP